MSIFQRGYACAVASIYSSHGNDVECIEALEAAGLTTMKSLTSGKIDPYDIHILTPLIKTIERKQKRRAKKAADLEREQGEKK